MLYLLLFIVGIVTSTINVMAGGGSFLTIPLLIFMGLPPTVANGTNRIGILFQSIFAVKGFLSHKVLPVKFTLLISIPAIIGSLIGAYLASVMDDESFRQYLIFFMLFITAVTIFRRGKENFEIEKQIATLKWVLLYCTFFVIGLYGGFIQAGVGFFILAGMVSTGFDLLKSNAVKTFLILIFTLFALPVFIYFQKISLLPGLVLGAGNIVGAIIGVKIAVKVGHKYIRYVVAACILCFCLILIINR